jgi:hypothetical protein
MRPKRSNARASSDHVESAAENTYEPKQAQRILSSVSKIGNEKLTLVIVVLLTNIDSQVMLKEPSSIPDILPNSDPATPTL